MSTLWRGYRENSAFGHCFFIEIATAGQISPRTLFGRDDKKGTVFLQILHGCYIVMMTLKQGI
jgi:hypothetical protein